MAETSNPREVAGCIKNCAGRVINVNLARYFWEAVECNFSQGNWVSWVENTMEELASKEWERGEL